MIILSKEAESNNRSLIEKILSCGSIMAKTSAVQKPRFPKNCVLKMTVGLKLLWFFPTSFELIFGRSCDLIRDSNRKLKELSFGPLQLQNGHTFDEIWAKNLQDTTKILYRYQASVHRCSRLSAAFKLAWSVNIVLL